MLYALIRFRARKHAVAAQIRGNTRLEVGWTVAAAVILIASAIVTFAKLSSIQNPPNSGPEGDKLARPAASRACTRATSASCRRTAKRSNINVIGRQFIWQFVYPGASEPDGLGAPYSYEEMVVPTEHDRLARHRLGRRRALLVGPAARRQVPGGAGLPQLHVVQDRKAGDLQGPVRCALRARARAHDRHRQGGPAGAVRRMAGLPEEAALRSQRGGEGRRAPNWAPRPAPDRSKTPRTTRRPAHRWPPYNSHRYRR